MPRCPLAGQPEATHRPEQDVSREPSTRSGEKRRRALPATCSPLRAERCQAWAQAGRERGSSEHAAGSWATALKKQGPASRRSRDTLGSV